MVYSNLPQHAQYIMEKGLAKAVEEAGIYGSDQEYSDALYKHIKVLY